MAQFITTLHSPLSNKGGVAIIDSDLGLTYMQSDALPKSILAHQLRGIASYKESIYITTPASVLVYKLKSLVEKPRFELQKEISLPEWKLGSNLQADLLGVLVSSKKEVLLVANNYFNSIDIFTLKGDFIRRRFLHEIAPELFIATDIMKTPFRYGQIRSICEISDGSILLSVYGINGSDRGCIVNFDNGKVVIDELQTPQGLVCAEGNLIVQEAGFARVSSYTYSVDGRLPARKNWTSIARFPDSAGTEESYAGRGLVYVNGSIYCGVFSTGRPTDKQIPSRIVSFDALTGVQNKMEICLPDIEGVEQPRTFFMLPFPPGIDLLETKKPVLFLNGKKIKGMPSSPPTMGALCDSEACLKPQMKRRAAVTLNSVSLSYWRTAVSHFSLKKHLRASKEFQALKNVSFTIYEGETVGIIGRNGSGKSTISMLISGALPVDSGVLSIRGHVQLLSIGLGFQPKLTGRENVFINGALLGLQRRDIIARMPEIVDFSEIGEFIDEPVRTYSAGMRSRLGFAIATAVRPDILILDEVMSTGDAAFRRKADNRMAAMREQTKTIIIVSHNANTIRKMCTRVIWLNKGELMMDGMPEDVLPQYNKFCYV